MSLHSFKITALAIALTATFALPAGAVGIPTLDAATGVILQNNAMAQAAQAADALKQAKDGIDQARQQYENYKGMITGNDQLGEFLNNPSLNQILPMGDWADIYTTAKDLARLRERYGLISDNASVQQRFDMILSGMDALERVYDSSTERVKNAERLRAELNRVETPQQKADLQLRYQIELIEQQNAQLRLASMQALAKEQEKLENRRRAQNYSDYMTGKTKVRPSYE